MSVTGTLDSVPFSLGEYKAFIKPMYANTHLGFVAIGVQLCLCYASFLAFRRTPAEIKKGRIPFMMLGFVLTFLYTLHAVADSISYSGMMISQRQQRTQLYLRRPKTAKRITLSTAAEVVAGVIGNGILLYRCYVIWHSYRRVLIVPALIYLTSLAMSILYLISGVSLRALATLGGITASRAWGTTWFILSVAVNILVTSLICFKLIRAQRRFQAVLNSETVQVYTGVVSILVESALPFTVLGIVAGVVNALGYRISSAFDEAYFAFCALAPQLIIFRVVTGRAWMREQDLSADVALSRPVAFTSGSSTDRSAEPTAFEEDK